MWLCHVLMVACLSLVIHGASLGDKTSSTRDTGSKAREAFLGIEDAEVKENDKNGALRANNKRNIMVKQKRETLDDSNNEASHKQKRFLEGVIYPAYTNTGYEAQEFGSEGWPSYFKDDDDDEYYYYYVYYYYYPCGEDDDEDCEYVYDESNPGFGASQKKKQMKKSKQSKATRVAHDMNNNNKVERSLKQRRFMIDSDGPMGQSKKRFLVDGEAKNTRANPSTKQNQDQFIIDTTAGKPVKRFIVNTQAIASEEAILREKEKRSILTTLKQNQDRFIIDRTAGKSVKNNRRMFVDDKGMHQQIQRGEQEKPKTVKQRFIIDTETTNVTETESPVTQIPRAKWLAKEKRSFLTTLSKSAELMGKSEERRMIVGDFSNGGPSRREVASSDIKDLKNERNERFLVNTANTKREKGNIKERNV